MKVQFSGTSARELASSIEDAVHRGALAPGASLPSVRELAAATGVSPTTAAAALTDLRRRGLIVTRPRRRSHVSVRPPLAVPALLADVPVGVRDLASGRPDDALLPDLGAALGRVDLEPRSYDDEPMLGELVELARDDFAEAGVPADDVCLVSGALDGVERVLGAHLGPGGRVAVEDPCYAPLLDLLRAMGLDLVPVPIDDRGLLPQPLERALSSEVEALVLTPRGQNPTGAALDRPRSRELARVLARYPDVLAVEDDHQGPLAGAPGLSIVRKRPRWARVRSVTKALGPDLRLAFVTGDELTVGRVEGRLALGPGWVSEILQRLVLELMTAEDVQTGLEHATRVYRARREALLAALTDRGIAATGRSGFNVWIPVPEESSVVSSLTTRGWFVAAGAPYRLESPPAVRVTTATLAPDEAKRLAADLAAVLTPARPRRAA
jgi:DNA-binding transcriptional MocR family regulator